MNAALCSSELKQIFMYMCVTSECTIENTQIIIITHSEIQG